MNYGYYNPDGWSNFTIDNEKEARGRFSRFFLAVFIFMITAYAVSYGIQFGVILIYGKDAYSALANTWWFSWLIQIISMYVIAFPIFLLITRGMKSVFRAKSKLKFTEFLQIFLVSQAGMMAGNLLGNAINSVLYSLFGFDISASQTDKLITDSPIWVVLIVAVIIGPIIEEIIFRKVLMDKLGMYGDRLAIIVSAVSFGIFHGNISQCFYAMILGLVLAYVYSKTANIIYPIILHMLVNFFGAFIPLLFLSPLEELMALYEKLLEEIPLTELETFRLSQLTTLSGIFVFIEMALPVAGLFIFFKKRHTIFVSDRCEICIPKENRASIIMLNVGAILFAIMIVVEFALTGFANYLDFITALNNGQGGAPL